MCVSDDTQETTEKTPKTRRHTVSTPSPKRLTSSYKTQIAKLKNLRSRDALSRRNLLESLVDPTLEHSDKIRYAKSVTEKAKAAEKFILDEAIDIPNKRAVSKKGKIQKKILTKRVKRLHREFCRNTSHKISLRTFYRMLPKNVLTSHKQKFQQCLCEYCTNIDLKIKQLNTVLEGNKIEGRDALSESSLCPVPTLACSNRTCPNCGVDKVRTSILQLVDKSQSIKWEIWKMVEVEKGGKRREKVQRQGNVGDLVEELMTELEPFSKHLLNFRWQYQQVRDIQSKLPSTWALVILDFSENFLCKWQDEVQSAHWGYNQVTIHPCVMYYKCPNPNCSEQVIDSLIFLSDDLSHDAHMVKVIQEKT